MRIDDPENDHLVKLLDGLSLLDKRDQERVINMVDTLDSADKKVKDTVFTENLPSEN